MHRSICRFVGAPLLLLVTVSSSFPSVLAGDCVVDDRLSSILGPKPADTCCQSHVCGLPCPATLPAPRRVFAAVAILCIVLSTAIGLVTYFCVRGQASNFFVAGRTLSLPVVAVTLASQSIDSNALLGNADLAYKFHLWDGAVLPIGLALSLFLNAILFAAPLNREGVFTLPDVFARRYGKLVEVILSCSSIVSFTFLLAGNVIGLAQIMVYVTGNSMTFEQACWLVAVVVWAYTACGGLFSVAYTDVAQGAIGWTGALICAFWFIHNAPSSPAPSTGFENYMYPNKDVCDLYNGVACMFNKDLCCFNPEAGFAADNGAYPVGDKRIFHSQMTSPTALSPFPNAILWNWATIFILGLGNLGALDFQARCLASKTPAIAAWGCAIAGAITLLVGIPFSYLGAVTRVFYGPDSQYAKFEPDSCSTLLGLPTCAEWVPDPEAFLHLLTRNAPTWVGGWCIFAIVSASLSTSDGAILALGTVFARNVLSPTLSVFGKDKFVSRHMLFIARGMTLPFAMIGGAVAAYSSIAAKLLIVAFDIMLATAVAPLFASFYVKDASPSAALLSVATGAIIRIVLEFALPKDGSFLLPYVYDEFKKYGSASSLKLPTFVDGNDTTVWNPEKETCAQTDIFTDFTGVDSLAAFFASCAVFAVVHLIEQKMGKRLFRFPGDQAYEKEQDDKEDGKPEITNEIEDIDDTGLEKEIGDSGTKV